MAPLVVCIDDEPTVCEVVARTLRRAGFEVRAFTDPVPALEAIEAGGVSLVLCDHSMPGTTGLEVRARLRAPVPFVLISGDLGGAREGAPGIDACLAKPFRPQELVELVRRLLPTPG